MVTLREDNAFDNLVSAIINLKQTSTVEKYRSQFEVLSIGILKYSTNEFWVNTFVSGLNVEIKLLLTTLKLTSLQAAFGFTLLHEEEALRRKQNPKKCDKIQETVEVLEERKEQVQPQKETAQELEPVFAIEEHPVVQSEELVEEYREEIPQIGEFQIVTASEENAITRQKEEFRDGYKQNPVVEEQKIYQEAETTEKGGNIWTKKQKKKNERQTRSWRRD
jgi:hypothetical protein